MIPLVCVAVLALATGRGLAETTLSPGWSQVAIVSGGWISDRRLDPSQMLPGLGMGQAMMHGPVAIDGSSIGVQARAFAIPARIGRWEFGARATRADESWGPTTQQWNEGSYTRDLQARFATNLWEAEALFRFEPRRSRGIFPYVSLLAGVMDSHVDFVATDHDLDLQREYRTRMALSATSPVFGTSAGVDFEYGDVLFAGLALTLRISPDRAYRTDWVERDPGGVRYAAGSANSGFRSTEPAFRMGLRF